MNVNYEYYRVFYYVARYQSFTKAAEALLNNQPNITRTIKKLEDELGCTLFVRSNRMVRLTPEGENLYSHVRIAFEHIQAAEKEIFLEKGLKSGVVTVGVSEIALHCMLLPVLKKYRQTYPGVRIRVSNYSTPQAVEALNNGLVDFSVVTTPITLPDYMKKITVKEIQEVAVCGCAYEELSKERQSMEKIAKYPIICLGQKTKTYEFYEKWFSEMNLLLEPDIEVATSDQILPMVRNNLGIGFVPEEFLKNESSKTGIHRIALEESIPVREVCLVKNRQHSLSIAAAELERMILG